MSRRAKSQPWRVSLDPIRRERVRQLRQQRRGPRWSRPLGLLLLGVAFAAMVTTEHPLPRGEAAASSARTRLELRPLALQPCGDCATRTPTFVWRWPWLERQPGPAAARYTLVLLDRELQEVLRVADLAATELPAAGPLAAALAEGAYFHWFVAAEHAGQAARSLVSPLVFQR